MIVENVIRFITTKFPTRNLAATARKVNVLNIYAGCIIFKNRTFPTPWSFFRWRIVGRFGGCRTRTAMDAFVAHSFDFFSRRSRSIQIVGESSRDCINQRSDHARRLKRLDKSRFSNSRMTKQFELDASEWRLQKTQLVNALISDCL